MREAWFDYEENKLPLNLLITRLRELFDCFQDFNEEWKQCFYENWFELVQVYAVTLDRSEPLTKQSSYIDESLSKLNALLEF